MVFGHHVLIVGLTGGIGSGKSTVSTLFNRCGIDVIDADKIARDLVIPGSAALEHITQHFGSQILSNGELDRPQLRELIFSSPTEKKWLEALLHPLIRGSITEQLAKSSSPYSLLEAPLLFENGLNDLCNRTVVVSVSEATQLARTMARDQGALETVKAIIASQIPASERIKKADYVIYNDDGTDELEAQVLRMHNVLLLMANNSDFI